jgi:hypothetical protein
MGTYRENLNEWFCNWKCQFVKHKYLILLSLGLLAIAFTLNVFSSHYVDKIPTTSVQDLILDHLPPMDDFWFLFVYGAVAVIAILLVYIIIFKVPEIHIFISQFSLLMLIRSFFIILTHLGQPAGAIAMTNLPWFYQILNYNNDLFFSAHTAYPFLAYLLLRKEKIGFFFLIMTVILAFVVLAMHFHYSIDVFSAIFITYGSYVLGRKLFAPIK